MNAGPFTPPSPGAWELERTHATRPISRFMWDIFPAAMARGFGDGTRAYGALLDHLELAVVNGFLYVAPRPVAAPKSAKRPPSKPVFKLLLRLHPEMRRRVRRASEVFKGRTWREELVWWDEEVKPSIAAEARTLRDEDPRVLDDAALADHLRRAAAFLTRTIYFHHRLNCCAIIPLADFLNHATQWTGLPADDVLATMRGQSPLSGGAFPELDALRAAFRADADALLLLMSPLPPAELLVALAQRATGVGAALRAYLDTVGLRVLGGYDVADRHAREHPDLIVNTLRAALSAAPRSHGSSTGQAISALRARVPEAHRSQFDALLEEAQLVYRVRDERNFCSDSIGIGLARRAILAAGERLRAERRAHDPVHLVNASTDEIVGLLQGSTTPTADELAARYEWQMTTPLDSAPDRLGFPPSAPPPADWLPRDAARIQRAVDTALQLMFATRARGDQSAATNTALRGFGVSPGVVEGPARVIVDVSHLADVQAGEILVTPATSPTFNVVLPLLSGIVTERGGALSHAAIVAREYGIPAVVGAPGATTQIKNGARIRVDGTKGEVWILS